MAEHDADAGAVLDLAALAGASALAGVIWAGGGADLNVNLVRFAAGEGVGEHVNSEVDVLLVGIAGAGVVAVDGRRCPLGAGQALIIPKGARRAIAAGGGPFAYLTCHRRRGPLRPAGRRGAPGR